MMDCGQARKGLAAFYFRSAHSAASTARGSAQRRPRGIGRDIGRGDGRLVGRCAVLGRDGASELPDALGRVEGIVVGPPAPPGNGLTLGRSGFGPGPGRPPGGIGGGTTTTGGYGA
jgi:hypothetical protein